jgi:spore maturation protein CgeB
MSPEPLRVLFVSLRWDYGDAARGDSFEYENLFGSIRRMEGVEAQFFGVDQEARSDGEETMNDRLVRAARGWQPNLVFCFLFKDELRPETLTTLRLLPHTKTLNWFADDHWRFQEFSRHWAPYFDWVVTTDSRAVPRYHAAGIDRAIHSQWAVNHHIYRVTEKPRDIDVSFVGQPYGHRREMIDRLTAEGIPVEVWGHGTERGRVDQSELVDILSRSKISLNFAASSPRYSWRYMAAQLLRRAGPIAVPRFGELRVNATILRDAYRPQLKARNFEIGAAGAMLLTEDVDELSAYFRPGVEAVPFKGVHDLVGKAKLYLADEEARTRIARAGQERTFREHTYDQRFRAIFEAIGLDPRG